MMPSEAKAANNGILLAPAAYANSATASNGPWLDIRGIVGTGLVVLNVGVTGGNVDGSLLTSANSNGAGNAALNLDASNNFTSTAGNVQELRSFDINKSKGYIHFIATLGGAANIAVSFIGRPKESV